MAHALSPPRAPRRPTRLEAHGDVRIDEFFWLRERENPEVRAYLEAENRYTEARTAHLADLRDALFAEIVGHVQEDDDTAPVPHGAWEYFVRTRAGEQYAIHLRRPRHAVTHPDDGRPEDAGRHERPEPVPANGEVIVLDENQRAAGHDFYAVGDVEMSPDHRVVAWTEDTTGGERHELRFHDLDSGRDLDDIVANTYYGLAWAASGRSIFYTRPDEAMRSFQVWRHELGSDAATDALVLEESDDRFDLYVTASRSQRWIIISAVSRVTSEVWVLPTAEAQATPRRIEPRREGVEYYVDHHVHDATGDRFLILTNDDDCANFELRVAAVERCGREHWEQLLRHDPLVRISNVESFRDFIAVHERTQGLERLRVMTLPDGAVHEIAMPEPVYSAWPGTNLEYDSDRFRYGYSSLVVPRSTYDYGVRSRTSHLVRQTPVPNYDPANYVTERAWAMSDDSTRVPISFVHRIDTPIDGHAPLYHYAYGSYEATVDPVFRAIALPLLDRGFVVALSHPRGGGEMGRQWWDDGHLEHKMNTFVDFNACTRHLHASGYGTPARTIARGGSAGGLLMGAITNLAPELYAGVIAEVPFVDVISTMQDPSIPLTVNEWDEWGDPRIESLYLAMLAYSPYDNLRAGVRYPRLLVTAGLNDPRVQYWEPAKYVAKLRTVSPDTDVILKTEMDSGHAGPSGRYDAWRDEAFVLAWILETVGLV